MEAVILEITLITRKDVDARVAETTMMIFRERERAEAVLAKVKARSEAKAMA